jgi:hypothetical protein
MPTIENMSNFGASGTFEQKPFVFGGANKAFAFPKSVQLSFVDDRRPEIADSTDAYFGPAGLDPLEFGAQPLKLSYEAFLVARQLGFKLRK